MVFANDYRWIYSSMVRDVCETALTIFSKVFSTEVLNF